MMSFAAPIMLVFLLLVPVAAFGYVWIERRREERAAQWARPALVPNLVDEAERLTVNREKIGTRLLTSGFSCCTSMVNCVALPVSGATAVINPAKAASPLAASS